MSRSPDRLRDHPWAARVEHVRADATDRSRRSGRWTGSMWPTTWSIPSAAADFEEADRRAARTFADAAATAGVRRVVYLGGLAPGGEDLSPSSLPR